MTASGDRNVKLTNELQETFGEYLELMDGDTASEPYRILTEFYFNGKGYAVLKPDGAPEGEELFFRIIRNERNEPMLETIDDDDEWEEVAEIYDEMFFPFEEE